MNTLAERLKWLRKKCGFASKADAAKAIGLKYGTYQGWEYGLFPSRRNYKALADYYECSLSWLQTGEGDPYPKAGGPDLVEKNPFLVKEAAHIYNKDTDAPQIPPEIRISEAMTMMARVLESGTSYATALYLNIVHFDRALSATKELRVCQEDIADLKNEVAALRRQVEALTAPPASSAQPAASLEKEAM